MKTIRSKDNPLVKELAGLAHSARVRKKSGLTVLDGLHLVSAYLDTGAALETLCIAESAAGGAEVATLLARDRLGAAHVLADNLMAALSGLDSPAAVIAVVRTPLSRPASDRADVLLLDNVQDPGNVGSLIRSAAAAGFQDVLATHGTAFLWSPKVLRAGQGAHFSLNLIEGADAQAFLMAYRGRSVALVAGQEGQPNLYGQDLRSPIALMIGNEGTGLGPALAAAATVRAHIPMPGRIESLNAAAAGAIALFECVRQRMTISSSGKQGHRR